MKSKSLKLQRNLMLVGMGMLVSLNGMKAEASTNDYLDSLTAGAAIVLESDIRKESKELAKLVEENTISNNSIKREETTETLQIEEVEESKTASGLFMARVDNVLNVRKEPSEDAEKVGVLYKDCGGDILETKGDWTKIKSGDVVGWAHNDYLMFGADAEKLAKEVGNMMATIKADALRVRKEASQDAGVWGLVGVNERLDVIKEENGWVSLVYEGEDGYLASEYVDISLNIDKGETTQAIQERQKKEAEEKAKKKKEQVNVNYGAMTADVSDVELLGALIQCEAGNQPYEGQVAVGAVVMNRVRHPAYPGSISGVIYASGQFTPALNGKVAQRVASGVKPSCLQAAQEAINGVSNVGNAIRFRRAGANAGIEIGNHVFW